jgi:hypothetical protein
MPPPIFPAVPGRDCSYLKRKVEPSENAYRFRKSAKHNGYASSQLTTNATMREGMWGSAEGGDRGGPLYSVSTYICHPQK